MEAWKFESSKNVPHVEMSLDSVDLYCAIMWNDCEEAREGEIW